MLRKLFYAFIWITLMAGTARAGAMNVACAADFTDAMKELAPLYVAQTGDTMNCTFGSTAMLYGQIRHGVVFDLFLAANKQEPAKLYEQGLALSPVTYAKGAVVLWTANHSLALLADWKNVLASPKVTRIGIATPKNAAYGQQAVNAMEEAELYDGTKPKLTIGKSVEAAFQYAFNGTADAAFVTLSQALSEQGATGKYWIVTEAGAVPQAASILKRGHPENARRFLRWMRTADAQSIIRKYGYN